MLYIRNLNTTKNLKIGIRKDQNRISSILVSLGGESEIRAARAHCCRYRIAPPSQASVVFCDDCHSLALPVSPTGCGRARPSVTVRNTIQAGLEPCSPPTKKTGTRPVFFVGGESEIRTLEPCYRLHDFQSCALDQLGEFSILFIF